MQIFMILVDSQLVDFCYCYSSFSFPPCFTVYTLHVKVYFVCKLVENQDNFFIKCYYHLCTIITSNTQGSTIIIMIGEWDHVV